MHRIMNIVFLTVPYKNLVIVRIITLRSGTASDVYLSKEIDPRQILIESKNMQN